MFFQLKCLKEARLSFKPNIYQNLMGAISELSYSEAIMSFTTHWSLHKSILDIPPIYICVERVVKLMEEIHQKNRQISNP